MSSQTSRFSDLGVRIASAVAMAAIGTGAVLVGGVVLGAAIALLAAVIGWEIGRMHQSNLPIAVGALACVAVFAASNLSWELRAPIILAAILISAGTVSQRKSLFYISFSLVILGALSVSMIASGQGVLWLVWLIGVVVLTDVAGYFAGRIFGGPKFWPSLSPKKTWSGTIAGWIAAGVFGAIMAPYLGSGTGIIFWSILASFASQMGDIFQSMCKRRAGIKDSSALIPGHGGFWDRFDGMLGAALVFWPMIWAI